MSPHTWNCCRSGLPLGSSAGAKQVEHSAHASGESVQGGWSGGGQCVPLAKARQHCTQLHGRRQWVK